MNTLTLHYLTKALKRLEKWLPDNTKVLLSWYQQFPNNASCIKIQDYAYCLFSLPCISMDGKEIEHIYDIHHPGIERIVLLVFDKDTIIADTSALHTSVHACVDDPMIINYLRTESDWIDLQHACLCEYYFANKKSISSTQDDTLLFTNAYVTKTFRRLGIFERMIQLTKEHALRQVSSTIQLYSIISLDPDIAQYGPDASDEPYYYHFEVDEPVRIQNAEIMKHLNFTPIRLEVDPDQIGDGTKLWFAIQEEMELY